MWRYIIAVDTITFKLQSKKIIAILWLKDYTSELTGMTIEEIVNLIELEEVLDFILLRRT